MSNNDADAFRVVEQAKTRVLVEQLALMELRAPSDLDPALLDEERNLLAVLRSNEPGQRTAVLLSRDSQTETQTAASDISVKLESVWQRMAAHSVRAAEYVALRRATPLSYDRLQAGPAGGSVR